MSNIIECTTPEAAKTVARNMGRETGDIWCSREWRGQWIAYPLGFDPEPVANEDEEDDNG